MQECLICKITKISDQIIYNIGWVITHEYQNLFAEFEGLGVYFCPFPFCAALEKIKQRSGDPGIERDICRKITSGYPRSDPIRLIVVS